MYKSICISLPCIDFGAMEDFYASALGFLVELSTSIEVAGIRMRRLSMYVDEKKIITFEFYQQQDNHRAVAEIVVTLEVENLSEIRRRLEEHFPNSIVRFDSTPFSDFLVIKDPAGTMLRFSDCA